MSGPPLEPLTEFLHASDAPRVVAQLSSIEDLIGGPLPASAWRYRSWWSNAATHATAWVQAGYRTSRTGVGADEIAFLRTSEDGRSRRQGAGRPRQYERLRDFLAAQDGPTVDLTFTEIEEIIERPLANSAYQRARFWSDKAPHAYAWREAGFHASRTGVGTECIRFAREEPAGMVASTAAESAPDRR